MTAIEDTPDGCLACNHDAVAAALHAHGYSERVLQLVPEPKHSWIDIIRCHRCRACWLMVKPHVAMAGDARSHA